MVMASGIQISNPVMKYFFTAPEMKSPARAGPVRMLAQAQSVAAGVGLGLVSVFVSVFASVLDSVFFSACRLPAPLKSVAYQPLPFSWKPAALSSFCSLGLPQAGQTL